MNVPLILAGSLAILGAAIHGVGGEMAVVRRLSLEGLPSSRFGGPRATKAMIHTSWHMTTVAFLTVGAALLVAGVDLHGHTARAIGVLAAGGCTGFAAVAVGLGAGYSRRARGLFLHPAPVLLTVTAVLAWWGAL